MKLKENKLFLYLKGTTNKKETSSEWWPSFVYLKYPQQHPQNLQMMIEIHTTKNLKLFHLIRKPEKSNLTSPMVSSEEDDAKVN